MSKLNICIGDWIALVRRIVGEDTRFEGELILVSQLWNRIDLIAREFKNKILTLYGDSNQIP